MFMAQIANTIIMMRKHRLCVAKLKLGVMILVPEVAKKNIKSAAVNNLYF
jgi:hypothetical protein